jgi:molybdopterin-guanine dinucleotide biosynthesis protein B
MNIIAVSGYKDSGKSSLCRALIGDLKSRGFEVGYIKRTRDCAASPPDTDTGAVNAIGAPALLWGGGSLRFETRCAPSDEADVRELAGRYFPCADVVILEGGKDLDLPKIWVAKDGEPVPDVPGVFAVYDRHIRGREGRVYGGDCLKFLVADIMEMMSGSSGAAARVYIDDRELPLKDFVGMFIAGGVRGMLGTLKLPSRRGGGGKVRIYLDM